MIYISHFLLSCSQYNRVLTEIDPPPQKVNEDKMHPN